MTRISSEQVRHVANLARLEISEEETESFREQLDRMITFAEQLNELDTDGVEPTSHVLDMKNVMREDAAKHGLPQSDVVKNAPDHQGGFIKVPSIMNED